MQAAAIAVNIERSLRWTLGDQDCVIEADRGLMVAAWQAVAPDRDIAAELQAVRDDLERKDREMADQMAINPFPSAPYGRDLDDFIPF